MTKTIAAICVMAGFASTSYGQASDVAVATALLVVPISIENDAPLNFGVVAASGTPGTIVMSPAGVRTAGVGGASLRAGGAPTAAAFTVTGEGNSTYSITIPTDPITLSRSGGGDMTVSNFICDLGNTGTLTSGTQELNIGATLNVDANELAGTYENTSDLTVTVNYN